MSKKLNIRFLLYGILLVIFLFYYFGRTIWYPVYIKMVGKKSLIDVYNTVGKSVEDNLHGYFKKVNANYPPSGITIIGLKSERQLEIWAEEGNAKRLVQTYKFTGYSGTLGPKLKSGDRQIPEGLYKIEYLNPNSSFYLSMKIDYPNAFDVQKSRIDGRSYLGGDIFIHGKSATIGCIPIGDANIEELFTLVYRTGIENTNVIIAPYDMRKKQVKIEISEINWLEEKYQRITNALHNYNDNI